MIFITLNCNFPWIPLIFVLNEIILLSKYRSLSEIPFLSIVKSYLSYERDSVPWQTTLNTLTGIILWSAKQAVLVMMWEWTGQGPSQALIFPPRVGLPFHPFWSTLEQKIQKAIVLSIAASMDNRLQLLDCLFVKKLLILHDANLHGWCICRCIKKL